jgi:hypothetical protein
MTQSETDYDTQGGTIDLRKNTVRAEIQERTVSNLRLCRLMVNRASYF